MQSLFYLRYPADMSTQSHPHVVAVARDSEHRFSKSVVNEITLIAGLGVEGDAHCGATVQHLSRVAVDPSQPNLRQVHLIHAELFEELAARGFAIGSGVIGENITTRCVDLLSLPVDTELAIGRSARIRITGLRNPCAQLDRLQPGLMQAVLDRDAEGNLVRKSGVMGIVIHGGAVKVGDEISVNLPPLPHRRLERV